jgi:hypothetical protein
MGKEHSRTGDLWEVEDQEEEDRWGVRWAAERVAQRQQDRTGGVSSSEAKMRGGRRGQTTFYGAHAARWRRGEDGHGEGEGEGGRDEGRGVSRTNAGRAGGWREQHGLTEKEKRARRAEREPTHD